MSTYFKSRPILLAPIFPMNNIHEYHYIPYDLQHYQAGVETVRYCIRMSSPILKTF